MSHRPRDTTIRRADRLILETGRRRARFVVELATLGRRDAQDALDFVGFQAVFPVREIRAAVETDLEWVLLGYLLRVSFAGVACDRPPRPSAEWRAQRFVQARILFHWVERQVLMAHDVHRRDPVLILGDRCIHDAPENASLSDDIPRI